MAVIRGKRKRLTAEDTERIQSVLPDKQAITGNNYGDYDDDLPVLQVEQVKLIRPDTDL